MCKRLTWVSSIVAAAIIVAPLSAFAAAQFPLVLKLTLHDTVQPISAGYLQRGLGEAARRHAALVLISLDTPGGLLDSTRTMVAAIERSPVPVAIFVSPNGARAGSAGFFLLEAADIAVMAPGTNAGAAHPIIEGRALDPVLKEKIENDAAAFLRSYTVPRGRNAEAAEDAVRNSKSYSDTEAWKLKLIDFIAPDDTSLLRSLDNRPVRRFDGTSVTLHLTSATISDLDPSLRENLLTRLTDPNLAVLLLLAGILLIYLEFNAPGTIIPGSLGALLILLALFGLGTLPIHRASIVLMFAALVLLLLEVKVPSHGILALAGSATLVFGLFTLVDSPIAEQHVHLATALAAGLAFGIITVFLLTLAARARRNKTLLGAEAMLDRLAVARTPLSPAGQVEVRGELWQAMLLPDAAPLEAGSLVRVRQIIGLTLLVEPAHLAAEGLIDHLAE